ncbi:unnamed protein product [Paramecium sonneborni]|uniref:Uncharacterized protein n=1 Tax=Paramecium sonneborni TaxID=65129 RepID=A0A8S1KVT7_9CILI|nr:unnamed protein product [Paramecium sonneborni]
MFIPLFVLYFIIFIIYRGSKNPLEESNKIAILTHTLIFQYIMICFGIVQFKTLNQGFLYVQITESHIVLILIVFFVRPIQSFNLRNLKFWWMFGVPVIAYFLSLKFQIWFWNDASQRLVLIHNSLSQMMIFVFMILSLFE